MLSANFAGVRFLFIADRFEFRRSFGILKLSKCLGVDAQLRNGWTDKTAVRFESGIHLARYKHQGTRYPLHMTTPLASQTATRLVRSRRWQALREKVLRGPHKLTQCNKHSYFCFVSAIIYNFINSYSLFSNTCYNEASVVTYWRF